MKIEFNYERSVSVIPASVWNKLERASKIDIRVLFALTGIVEGVDINDVSADSLAKALGIKPAQAKDAIDFWQKAGVILTESVETEPTEEKIVLEEPKKEHRVIVRRSDDIPNYSTDEISAILEKRKETSYLLDECQQEIGKMFSTRDLNIIVGMLDYLGVDMNYVVAVLRYCNNIGKRSMSYAEKLAFHLVEEGIDNADDLKIRLDEMELSRKNEGEVRKLFGMKSRALTAKEKKKLELWFGQYGYDMDFVRLAYELTIEAINEPSVNYAHAILERWYNEGVKTIEDARKSNEEKKAQRVAGEPENKLQGSFDTDDFFEAALKRSYQDYKAE